MTNARNRGGPRPGHGPRRAAADGSRTPGRGAGTPHARPPTDRRPRDLAQVVAAADDLERALETLEATPGVREAVLAELGRRQPGIDEPSPWSTAVLVRLAGRVGGRAGHELLVPFLADGNALVQVEAAEALDDTPLEELREVFERLAKDRPDGAFWEAVFGLLEAREERGICRLVLDLAGRLTGPGALAAALEALPYLASAEDAGAVRAALRRFACDARAVPGALCEEGPVTLGMVADLALHALDAAEAESGSDGER